MVYFNPIFSKKATERMATYKPTREKFPLMDALAMAVAVDRVQGFIKINGGYFDDDTEKRVEDNRTVVLHNLRAAVIAAAQTAEGNMVNVQPLQPTDEDRAKAKEIFDYFDQSLMMDKLGDNLVKKGKNGTVNDYNLNLSQVFDSGEVDTNKELSMVVSLPNSRRVAIVRERMEEFYRARRSNGYVGEIGKRVKVTGQVMDVKFLPSYGIHLATVVTTNDQIVKFFLNDKLASLAKTIKDTTVTVTGTVKKQDINPQNSCQETVINRVKFDN